MPNPLRRLRLLHVRSREGGQTGPPIQATRYAAFKSMYRRSRFSGRPLLLLLKATHRSSVLAGKLPLRGRAGANHRAIRVDIDDVAMAAERAAGHEITALAQMDRAYPLVAGTLD